MGKIFREPLTTSSSSGTARERGVTLGTDFMSWQRLREQGAERARHLKPGAAYVADPCAGFESFVSLFAICMTENATLFWARSGDLPFPTVPIAPALYMSSEPQLVIPRRPRFATLTSGSSGQAKIPMGYGDLLELVALQYDQAMYQRIFPGDPSLRGLATCLPLEYAAAFMMVVLPAMFTWQDLLIFPPHRWDLLLSRSRDASVVCIAVPALLAAAAASVASKVEAKQIAVICTAGYLARSRIESMQSKIAGIRLLTSYGASETGVMTLDENPDGTKFHVGRPIYGKPVWLIDVDGNGTGKIATAGPDCRDCYYARGSAELPLNCASGSTDLGHFDESGNLYLDGRLDGGSKLRGITLYPKIIERHLLSHPRVVDARVTLNESGLGYVEALVIGSATQQEIQAHCADLPENSRPTRIECVQDHSETYSSRGKL